MSSPPAVKTRVPDRETLIFRLEKGTGLELVRHALYRRKINQVGSELTHHHHAPSSPNRVRVDHLATMGLRERDLRQAAGDARADPVDLAQRAIASPGHRRPGGARRHLYLIGVNANGVTTPLAPSYEREILRQTGTASLSEALKRTVRSSE